MKQQVKTVLPPAAIEAARQGRRWFNRRRHPAWWGTLRRAEAFSTYGYERGTPVDRVFIERFLDRHANDVQGEVLEVKDSTYATRFGGEDLTGVHVVDVDRSNPAATMYADLGTPDALPAMAYDCIVFTQTLQVIADLDVAVGNLHRALRPGGVLLVTVPAVARGGLPQDGVFDGWRFTPGGLEHVLTRRFLSSAVTTGGVGNLTAVLAYLLGLAAEDLREHERTHNDPAYPVTVWGRAVREAIDTMS